MWLRSLKHLNLKKHSLRSYKGHLRKYYSQRSFIISCRLLSSHQTSILLNSPLLSIQNKMILYSMLDVLCTLENAVINVWALFFPLSNPYLFTAFCHFLMGYFSFIQNSWVNWAPVMLFRACLAFLSILFAFDKMLTIDFVDLSTTVECLLCSWIGLGICRGDKPVSVLLSLQELSWVSLIDGLVVGIPTFSNFFI